MNTQRFSIFLIAILGLISTFLPWYSVKGSFSINGISSFMGWLVFILFGIIMILCLRRNLRENVSVCISWWISILGVITSFLVLLRVLDIYFSKEGFYSLGGDMIGMPAVLISVEFGAWLVIISGIAIPVALFLFRNKKRDL